MFSLLKKIKVRINYWLDRIIEECNLSLMGIAHFPFNSDSFLVRKTTRFIGDLRLFFKSFPRLSIYVFQGSRWKVVYIGSEGYLGEITCMFFGNENIQPGFLLRVPVWRLRKTVQEFLKNDTDLVICELCRLFPLKFDSQIVFKFPEWVNQQLTIPEEFEEFLAGPILEDKRGQINKANKYSVGWYFTQSEEDFKYFHYEMYLPFISSRHRDLALLSDYESQFNRWFKRGGLVMVTENNEPVAGMICVKAGKVMYAIEAGILPSKLEGVKYSIFTYLFWAGIQWAYHEKAEKFDIGGTRALLSNLSFRSKKRWGGEVIRHPKIFYNYTCLAEKLPKELREYINELGFITERQGNFYRVYLTSQNELCFQADSHL